MRVVVLTVALAVVVSSVPASAEPPRLVPAQRATVVQHKKAAREHMNNRDDLLSTAEWRAAAELGDAEAQFTLARRLERGRGVMDYPDLLAKAKVEAEQWDAAALAQGYGPAIERIRKVAEQGDARAQAKLAAVLAAQGDTENAVDYFRAAVDADVLAPAELRQLADLLADGHIPSEPGEVATLYERALARGDDEAEVRLADLYFEGKAGIARDPEQGQRILMKGVAKGRVPAVMALGRRFEHGDGLEQNHAAALRIYAKSPAREAVLARALLLVEGVGVKRDPRTHVTLLREHAQSGWFPAVDALLTIATKGEQGAQLLVADMYLRGEGLEQDSYEAVRWYEEAAAQGNPGALYTLGLLHQRGEGCIADTDKARGYYERASAAGSLEARQKLSLMR